MAARKVSYITWGLIGVGIGFGVGVLVSQLLFGMLAGTGLGLAAAALLRMV